jgi:hypothetical protein
MKKLFSLVAAIAFVVTLVVSATTTNAQTKNTAIAVQVVSAIAGASSGGSASRTASMVRALRSAYPLNPVIADDSIRIEAYLKNGESNYIFQLKSTGNDGKTEKRLNDQDAFRPLQYGVFLMKESLTVPGIGVLETFPNPTSFPVDGAVFNPEHLEHIYNGELEFKVGDTLWAPGIPIDGCRIVGTAQQQNAATRSQKHPSDGYIDAVPQYTFKGRDNNKITLKVPGDVAQKVEMAAASGYRTKVVLILKGLKVTGAGNVTPTIKGF